MGLRGDAKAKAICRIVGSFVPWAHAEVRPLQGQGVLVVDLADRNRMYLCLSQDNVWHWGHAVITFSGLHEAQGALHSLDLEDSTEPRLVARRFLFHYLTSLEATVRDQHNSDALRTSTAARVRDLRGALADP